METLGFGLGFWAGGGGKRSVNEKEDSAQRPLFDVQSIHPDHPTINLNLKFTADKNEESTNSIFELTSILSCCSLCQLVNCTNRYIHHVHLKPIFFSLLRLRLYS